MKQALTIATALSAAACGGKSTDLEGIWTVDTWNQNPTSCADPGPDDSANHDPFLFVMMDNFLGYDFLGVGECPDPATCATAPEDESGLFSSYLLDKGSDSKGWTGTISYAFGPDDTNNCSGGVSNMTLTVDAGGAGITLREEDVDVASFAPRGDQCEPEDAAEAAETLPCTSLEVVHATFMAAFCPAAARRAARGRGAARGRARSEGRRRGRSARRARRARGSARRA